MTTWRLQTLTKGDRVHHIAPDLIKYNIAGCGFGIGRTFEKNLSFDEYSNFYEQNNKKVPVAPLTLHDKVSAGDYIWIRNEGRYFIGKVQKDSHWKYMSCELANKRDIHNILTDVKWRLAALDSAADESDIPGAITTSFIRGRTIQRILKPGIEEYSKNLYAKIMGENPPRLTISSEKFFSYIGTEQLEDLVYSWLYDRYRYIVVPSTDKLTTPLYEYVLLNPNDKSGNNKIYVQTKLGDVDLNVDDYKHLDGRVFLITTQGRIMGNSEKVTCIDPKDLYEFANNQENWPIIPKSITNWFTMFSAE